MKWLSCVWAAALLLGGCSVGHGSLLDEASNAASQTVCSGVFVSGLSADVAYDEEVRPEPGVWAIDWALHTKVDAAHREVRSNILGLFPSRAVFRDGRGCTLIHDLPPPESIRLLPSAPTQLPDIAGSAPVAPESPALRAAIDAAFIEPGGTPRLTKAVVVVHNGRVIGERYAPGIGIDSALDGHSLAKSIANALVGILVEQGRLDVHAHVATPEWSSKDSRAAITTEDLLRMRAGFDFDEGQGAGAATQMWYTQDDTAHFAVEQPLVSAVGSRWHYSNESYAILSRVLKNAVGGPQALSDFVHRQLLDPLGMHHVTIEFDGAGNMMGANAVFASARDWARFGLLYLDGGVVGGKRILPKDWVQFSTTPTLGGGYGAGFWLNNTNAPVPTWGFPWGLPGVPADTYFGRGHMGQWVVIVPSQDLVVVRMGFSHGDAGEMHSAAALVRAVVRALHSRS